MAVVKVQREIAGRTMTLETGRIAKQSHGAVLVTYGDTVVLATVLTAPPTREIDFFPLYVDYRENQYAAGKVPGGFFKREGRPSTKEILTMRMIDRPIRPLFPADFRNEVQIQCMVLSSDNQNDPDLLAMVGASAALTICPAPFDGPIGCAKAAYVDGEFIMNPTHDDLANSTMDLLLAGPAEALNMIEFTGFEVAEDVVAEGIARAQAISAETCELIQELADQCEIAEAEYEQIPVSPELKKLIEDKAGDRIREAKQIAGKADRYEALMAIRQEILDEMCPEDADEEEHEYSPAQIKEAFYKTEGKIQRDLILGGTRPDGRAMDEIRPLGCETSILPRTHGSAIFARGETQALVTATLGTPRDQQIIDGLLDEYKKPFMLHYNFPPFSVGEIRPIRGPGRREIGHGMLAEKSLQPVMPAPDDFPYTVRLVADIMESNGSTSQAATTGGTLALMDAGVPIKRPVAGISIGMVSDDETGKYALLTDIVGEEDFHGDMDFKVAGTSEGITGIQLDMKRRGIEHDRIVATLAQAKKARLEIIDAITAAIEKPREELSQFAPRMLTIKINPDKIGKLIGPGGKMINKIQDETEASIDIEEDGTVYIAAKGPGAEAALAMVRAVTEDPEIGSVYNGRVVSTRDFGAFVEILPGTEALVHVSELSGEYVEHVEDVCKVGDTIEVKVINIDDSGKVKASRKALLIDRGEIEAPAPREDGDRGGDRRGGSRGGRGGRGGNRGGGRRDGGRDRHRDD